MFAKATQHQRSTACVLSYCHALTDSLHSRKGYLGGVPDLSSKLAPGPLPDSPVLNCPIGFDPVDSLGHGPLAVLADP